MEDRMKKIFGVAVAFSLLLTGVVFGQIKAKDGVYFAQDEAYGSSGWREQVVVKVVGGKIADVTWNGVSNLGGADKVTVSVAGGYGMEKASKLKLRWDQQAKNVATAALKSADGTVKATKDGTADGITGASMHVAPFNALVAKALASAPVAKGPFKKDGWFFASQAAFDAKTGWKDNVLVTVVNGTIVDSLWNGVNKDPKSKSKLVVAIAGGYGMAKAAKQGEWNVQSTRVDAAIVAVGDPAKIPLKADGTTDAITGATLHPTAVSLAVEALKTAR
jgi:major membrane immunogen (membrane-anchored lipoprotein)